MSLPSNPEAYFRFRPRLLGVTPREGDSKQAAWRTDPAQTGASFFVADLGTLPLSEFVTGRRTAGLAADLQTMVLGRRLEDNAHILLRFDDHADILVARQGGGRPTRCCRERR